MEFEWVCHSNITNVIYQVEKFWTRGNEQRIANIINESNLINGVLV